MLSFFGFLKSTFNVRFRQYRLVDQVMLLNSIITCLTVFWARLISQAWLSAVALLLWVSVFIFWLELKHLGE